MGPLAISTIGVVSIAPVLATLLKPILIPVYAFFGADPSMFASSILACDMGGYTLAMELAHNHESGLFSGLIVGSMLGPTISFMIPVALGIIEKEDYDFLAKGVLVGIVTIPLGALMGGIAAGFHFATMLYNLIPILILSLFIVMGLVFLQNKMILGLKLFGRAIYSLVVLSTIIAVFQSMTGIILIEGMAPLWDGIRIVSNTAIILSGTFPLIYFINILFSEQINRLGHVLKIENIATLGMISLLTTSIFMFESFKDMDNHGKLLNMTFNVSGNAILGGHLAFTLAVFPDMLLPVLVAKSIASISAVLLANVLFSNKPAIQDTLFFHK